MSDKRAQATEKFWEMAENHALIELVRKRERHAYSSPPRIPLYCSGHRTGVALVLMTSNEIDEGAPVPEHIELLTVPDAKANQPGTAEHGQSYTVRCGTCGRSTRKQDVKLLRAALECLAKSDTRGYSITIT